MNILITGTSKGIGKSTAIKFLQEGHKVFGIDIENNPFQDFSNNTSNSSNTPYNLTPEQINNYTHYIADITQDATLPSLTNINILINNAGIQSGTQQDIQTNLIGTMNVTEKYAFQQQIKSVLFNSSVSSLTGNEFPTYVASKAGVTGYMKNCAIRLANQYKATCNALCFGGVLTELNKPVIEDPVLWKKIMDVTPLKKWATPEEAAQWCYFMTIINTFCTGQAIDISGGERNCLDLFVWE